MFKSCQISESRRHRIQDFKKKNDWLTKFCHIQVGPQGFLISNKQKKGLYNLESNNRKLGQYMDHC